MSADPSLWRLRRIIIRLSPAASLILFFVAQLQRLSANDGSEGNVVVSSVVSRGYKRPTRGDGTIQPETYVVAKGGCFAPFIADNSIDKFKFEDVLHLSAVALAKQHYVAVQDPNEAKLLIKIFYGTTAGDYFTPDKIKYRRNANFMGYENFLEKSSSVRNTIFQYRFSAQAAEFYRDRYFVVLIAYDYKSYRLRDRKALWMTRFSMAARGVAFNEEFAAMTTAAAPFFGRPTEGLAHRMMPDGKIETGELQVIGTTP